MTAKEKKMKKIILAFLTFVLTFSISENSFADDQYSEMEGNVFNIQVQQCTLNSDTSIKQYDSMINDYFKWAKKNDAEVFSHAKHLYMFKIVGIDQELISWKFYFQHMLNPEKHGTNGWELKKVKN